MESPPTVKCNDPIDRADIELNSIIPDNPNQPYNMREIIRRVCDSDSFFRIAAKLCKKYDHRIFMLKWSQGVIYRIVANDP